MEDLSTEDLKQIINFYKQKSADLELQLLQSQIKVNKLVSSMLSENKVKNKK